MGDDAEKPSVWEGLAEPSLMGYHAYETGEIGEKLHHVHELGEAREAVESTGEAADAARDAAAAQRAVSEANPDIDSMYKMAMKNGAVDDAPGFSAAEDSFFADGEHASALSKEAATEAEMTGGAGGRMLGGAMGALGIVGGGMQIAEGANEWAEGKKIDGGVDMAAGGIGVVAGGLGLASSVAGGAALGGGLALAASVAAPVAAIAGLAALGEHEGEKLGLFGTTTGEDGKTRNEGAFEAAADWGADVTKNDGALLGAGAYALGETGALAANIGLGVYGVGDGIGSLAASTGMFGKDADGKNQGAFGLLDEGATAAGNAVTSGADSVMNAFGISTDPDSVGGEIASGLGTATHVLGDVAGAGVAAVADVGGALVGGAEAAGHWLSDLF